MSVVHVAGRVRRAVLANVLHMGGSVGDDAKKDISSSAARVACWVVIQWIYGSKLPTTLSQLRTLFMGLCASIDWILKGSLQ